MTATCTPTKTASSQETLSKPRYSINASKDAYQVQVELPGVTKDGLQVNLDQGVLTVKATRKSVAQDSWKSLYRELNDSGYDLRLKVNARVDESALTAKLEDGILTLTLPVKEADKPRVITVE